MKKIIENTKAFFKGKVFKRITCYATVALLIFASGYIVSVKANNEVTENSPELVNTRVLKSELIKSSELTTAKFNLTGISEFKDTGVVILNRSDFIMVY